MVRVRLDEHQEGCGTGGSTVKVGRVGAGFGLQLRRVWLALSFGCCSESAGPGGTTQGALRVLGFTWQP